MTDGGVYLGVAGGDRVELKRFDVPDGLGVHLLRAAGLVVAVVTGRAGDAARLRAEELEVDEFWGDAGAKKLPAFEEILQRRKLRWEEACFIGDDLPDLPVLRRCGLAVTVPEAPALIRTHAHYVTTLHGGRGAVREVCELLMQAQGTLEGKMREYLR